FRATPSPAPYPLSLHDALPISAVSPTAAAAPTCCAASPAWRKPRRSSRATRWRCTAPRTSRSTSGWRADPVSPSAFSEQRLPPWRRAVLKVGSSLLAANGGGLSTGYAQATAGFVNACHGAGRQVVVVSSGAVAAGRAIMREQPHDGAEMAERQALAALGQARLIGFWQGLLDRQVA